MSEGLMWFSKSTDAVLEAADRYAEKFGTDPDICHAYSGYQGDAKVERRGKPDITVVQDTSMPKYHFLIGLQKEGV